MKASCIERWIRRFHRVRLGGHQPRDQVLAGGVDDVEQDDQQRDQAQITALRNTRPNPPPAASGVPGVCGARASPAR